MKSTLFLSSLAATASALGLDMSPPHPDFVFQNPVTTANTGFKIPTSYESAVMGRRILALTKLGHLATVFPTHQSSEEVSEQDWRRPENVGGSPIGMMDYVADCEDEGNPTILAISIATSFQNVRAGSNISVSMRWTPPYPPSNRMGGAAASPAGFLDGLKRVLFGNPVEDEPSDDEDAPPDTVPYSAANLPRFSLIGYLEKIHASEEEEKALAQCFVKKHHDAKYWLPGNRVHRSEWARIVVTSVYWVGGFGDRAYIGWLPIEEWNSVTAEEWQSIRLPGEKEGWKEWSVDQTLTGSDL